MTIDIDVVVHEVGPRDGLQAVNAIYPTQGKLEWIEAEAASVARVTHHQPGPKVHSLD